MPGAHRKKSPGPIGRQGRHRKPGQFTVTWRTTGGVLVGAVVFATAAATAQASVLPFGSVPEQVSAADPARGRAGEDGKDGGSPVKDRTSSGKSGTSGKPRSGDEGGKRDRPRAGDGRGGEPKNGEGGAQPDGQGSGGSDEQPAKPRPTAEEAIELARSQVGITEDANGETKYNRWYRDSPRAKETVARDGGSTQAYAKAPWCDMFISWLGEQLGFADQFGSDAWTVAHARWFRDQGRWGTEPRPGAIVFYAWNGGKNISDIVHIGIVTRQINDTTVEAIEGNSDNAVRVKQRSTSTVVGYGYPEYRS
ncbi:MAG: CHAP domain-containing protein [Actinomadura sp.]